jgi:hypothetical protein
VTLLSSSFTFAHSHFVPPLIISDPDRRRGLGH